MRSPLHRALLALLFMGTCLPGLIASAETHVLKLHVHEKAHGLNKPVPGVVIGVAGDGSYTSDENGTVEIRLGNQTQPGDSVTLQIVQPPRGKKWVLLEPYRTVPSFEEKSNNFVDVLVVEYGNPKAVTQAALPITESVIKRSVPRTTDTQAAEDPKDAVAKQLGVTSEQLDEAILALKTGDPYFAGLKALYLREYGKATSDLQESLELREGQLASDPKVPAHQKAVANAAFFLGQSLWGQGKYRESATAYERSLALLRLTKDGQGEALVLLRLGQLSNLQEKPETFEKAIVYFTEAVPLFEAASDQFNAAYCWWGMATAYDRLGRAQQARDAYLKTLPFFVAKKDDRALGRVLLDLGEDEDALGNSQKAVEYYEQALPWMASQEDGQRQGLALVKMGKARQRLGESAGAIDAYKAAIPAWHSAGDKADEATSYLLLGQALDGINDRKGALDAYAEALKLFEATGDGLGQVSALIVMSGVYSSEGDHKKALELEQKALKILGPLDAPAATNKVLSDMGMTYYALGDYAAAEPVMRQALAGCEKTLGPDHPAVAYSLHNLANLLQAKGDYAGAEPLLRRALAIDEKALGPDHPTTQAYKSNLDELRKKMAQTTTPKPQN